MRCLLPDCGSGWVVVLSVSNFSFLYQKSQSRDMVGVYAHLHSCNTLESLLQNAAYVKCPYESWLEYSLANLDEILKTIITT